MDLIKLTTGEWAIVFATLMGPILAVQAQKFLERIREHESRKLWIFSTLMTTRRSRLSVDHVKALNMIDVSFYGFRFLFFVHWQTRSEKKVITAWKAYLDNLATDMEGWPDSRKEVHWNDRDRQFATLLVLIGSAVGYDFDEVHIKKAGYIPIAHNELEEKQRRLLDSAVNVLQGDQPLKMNVVGFPVNEEAAEAHRKMISQLVAATDGGLLKVSTKN